MRSGTWETGRSIPGGQTLSKIQTSLTLKIKAPKPSHKGRADPKPVGWSCLWMCPLLAATGPRA